MTASELIMIAAAETLLNLACASQTGAVKEGSPQIALRRGGSSATYAFALPTILGSTAQLRLEGQTLHGFVGTGSLHVKIDNDRASGFGPSGSIDVGIRQQGGDVLLDGLWNGGPVHLDFGSRWLKGTVVRWGANVTNPAMCGYDLDHRDQGGAFVGTSTCEGMPQRTWLEVDERVRRTLKASELAVLLAAILANPGPVR
jgi:hypothetical protein